MQRFAIIVAGGRGFRMGSSTPKQFLEVNGQPVIFYSIRAFIRAYQDIRLVVVLPAEALDSWKEKISRRFPENHFYFASGGSERFLSVINGLDHVSQESWVAIHDAARPLITEELIRQLFNTAEKYGSAIPAIHPPETVRCTIQEKIQHSKIPHAVSHRDLTKKYQLFPRNEVFLIQTPQVFQGDKLKVAYQKLWNSIQSALIDRQDIDRKNEVIRHFAQKFTDDAAVWEFAGYDITICEGDNKNIKITHLTDLAFAECFLK